VAFTYFFRDRHTLELIAGHVLPVLRGFRYIQIWDAGCAHGPEPYSIAIVLRENMSHFLFRNVKIHATDVNGHFERAVKEAVYPEEQVRRIPHAIRAKYFIENGSPDHYKLVDEIKASVSFLHHDLLSLEPPRTGFGLVVCKNVLLHFSEEQRIAVIRMFHSAMRDDAFLLTEQTQRLPKQLAQLFEQVTPSGQLFRKAG